MTLQYRRILLGVTGSIAAYKACELVRLLVREGADVQVVMTPAAERFVQALTFEALSRRPVRTELFDREAEMAMSHIELARWADAVLIAPASANCLARLAAGAADDLLATLCLATRAPTAVAPAMNAAMWANPATQAHVRTLREHGLKVLEPDVGDQACGDTGPGRLPEPEQLRTELAELCAERNMQGITAVVTAGPTREAIDPARFISNFSTGRMGCAIAEALLRRGARVTLVHGPLQVPPPAGAELVPVSTAAEMHDAALAHAKDCRLLVAAAAVADWRPKALAGRKLKKRAGPPQLELEPTADLLAALGRLPDRPYLVGFAAETEDLIQHARAKLHAKGADLMVANRIGPEQGFGDCDTTLELVDAETVQRLGPGSKPFVARQLADAIAVRLQSAACAYDSLHADCQSTHSG